MYALSIIEIVKEWGTLAGIGGIALTVMLLLFRPFIAKDIFPRMSKGHGFVLLLLFLVFVWSTTMFGLWIYKQ